MRTMLLAFVFSASSAFAVDCPNLTGKYLKCVSTTGATEGSSDLIVTQKLVNGYNHYTLTSTSDAQETTTETYKADGRTYVSTQKDPDSGLTIKSEQRTTCGNGVVVSRSNIWMETEPMGSVTVTVSKSGKVMTQVISGTILGEEVSDKVLCE